MNFKCILIAGLGTTAGMSASAASLNGFDLTAYGFIKASAMATDKGLVSFNNVNLVGATHAAPQTRNQDKTSRFSFQTQQSRIGTTLKKDDVLARIEFDFVDFSKSSPTVQANPRVRIASVTYTWNTTNKVIIGQDWDLFAPAMSFTFDYLGNYFMAGNTGFMRQQAQYFKTTGDWEFGVALGMAGNNPGVTDADLELGKSPTYSGRITRSIKDGRIGVSTIYSTLHYVTTNNSSHDSYGYNAFFEKKLVRTYLTLELFLSLKELT